MLTLPLQKVKEQLQVVPTCLVSTGKPEPSVQHAPVIMMTIGICQHLSGGSDQALIIMGGDSQQPGQSLSTLRHIKTKHNLA